MASHKNKQRKSSGPAVAAAEIAGPAFVKVLGYDELKIIGGSEKFSQLQIAAKHRTDQLKHA